jgi:hypothetical protein
MRPAPRTAQRPQFAVQLTTCNIAASLVERTEKEGVGSAVNHSGGREILVGEDLDQE